MSKLERLIQELCPEGVEYAIFSTAVKLSRGVRVVRSQLKDEGAYPVYQNSLTSMGYYDKMNTPSNTTFIISAGAAGEIGYSISNFWAADDCFVCICSDKLISRFLYYDLLRQQNTILSQVRKASIPRLPRSAIENLIIPLPPLHVQREIVRILDTFTELTTELTTELAARKRQYEYYLQRLLSIDDGETKTIEIGEIGNISMCKRIMKSETTNEGEVPFFKIGTFGGEPNAYISRETFDKYAGQYPFPKVGEVLISAAGTIGRTVVYDGEPAYFQDSNIVWVENDESKILNRYLFYCYKLKPWFVSEGGTIARLYNDNLRRARILAPPLFEQARIVSILDRFDTLCNDLTSGLPAEIEARRKQYEYYRDKLLTFKEKAS